MGVLELIGMSGGLGSGPTLPQGGFRVFSVLMVFVWFLIEALQPFKAFMVLSVGKGSCTLTIGI